MLSVPRVWELLLVPARKGKPNVPCISHNDIVIFAALLGSVLSELICHIFLLGRGLVHFTTKGIII